MADYDTPESAGQMKRELARARRTHGCASRAVAIVGITAWPLFVAVLSFLGVLGWVVGAGVIVWYSTRALHPAKRWPMQALWRMLGIVWLIGWLVALYDLPRQLDDAKWKQWQEVASPLPELGALVSRSTGDWSIAATDDSLNDERLSLWIPHLLRLGVRDIHLCHTKITDHGVEQLKVVRTLKGVDLSDTGVTDDALRYVAELPQLYALNIQGTRVTDAGLQHLRGLRRLRSVYTWNTQVTEAGAIMLETSVRGLFVYRRPITGSRSRESKQIP